MERVTRIELALSAWEATELERPVWLCRAQMLFYAEQQERAARISRHFERAREWGAVEDAERRHEAEKRSR